MKFLDKARITISSGKGGDGLISWRREAGVAYGWPDGGDGGNGGSVYMVADSQESSLEHLHYVSRYKAEWGEPWRKKQQYGADAPDCLISVPVGTIVRHEGRIIAVMKQPGQKELLARGGKGWRWNMHFTTSVNQYPHFALLGEPGHKMSLELELELVADIGLIGMPSVGKSTLINALAHTKVKTADYHFTTLIPHLWVLKTHGRSLTIIDIPGLIKGASEGKWLGREFLRHIRKCRVFALVIDAYRYEQWVTEMYDVLDEVITYIEEYYQTWVRLSLHDGHLMMQIGDMTKYIHLLLNKVDMVVDQDIIDELQDYIIKSFADRYDVELTEHMIFDVSAATHQWLERRKDRLATSFVEEQEKNISDALMDLSVQPMSDFPFCVPFEDEEHLDHMVEYEYITQSQRETSRFWTLSDPEITKLVYQIPRGNQEAELWFRQTMKHEYMLERVQRAGIKHGDFVCVRSYYAWVEDKWIMMNR